MSSPSNRPGVSQLDHAHHLRLAGDSDQALRIAASILTAEPEDFGAAALVCRLLLDLGRAPAAGELAARLADAHLRRGDLPSALIAAQYALEAGGFADSAVARIAEAFGKGSPRISGAAQLRPPPLPTDIQVAPLYAGLSGGALADAAEKVAARVAKAKDPVPADASLPELPLFGALDPSRLRKLLSRMELVELDTAAYAVTEGEPGAQAFVVARGVLNVVRRDGHGQPVLLATLGPGAIFGEMALVSQAPRAASVVAVEPVQLLAVGRTALEELAREDPAIGRELGAFCYGRMISNLVRHSAILAPVAPEARDELVRRFTSERFEAGQFLVRRGEESDRLFLIASGGVQVRGAETDGERVVLAELGPGDVVGEISFVLRRPANADVVALHSTVALSLHHKTFSEVIRDHPELLRQLYETALQRDEETRSVVGQRASDASDVVLL